MMHALIILSLLSLYILACIGWGELFSWIFYKKTEQNNQNPIYIKLTISFFLGMGILAIALQIIAILEWFFPQLIFAILSIGAVKGIITIWRKTNVLFQHAHKIWKDIQTDTLGWKIISWLTLLLGLSGILSLGRAIDWDAFSVYMVISKGIATTQSMQLSLGLSNILPFYMAFGLIGEMHGAALISLGSPEAARLITWVMLIAGAVMLIGICSRVNLDRRGKWLALTMMFTSSGLYRVIAGGKWDLFPIAFGVAALYCALQPGKTALAGFFAGVAIVGKLIFGITFLPVFLILVFWQTIQLVDVTKDVTNSVRIKAIISQVFVLGLWTLPIVIPMLVKNFIVYGNPLEFLRFVYLTSSSYQTEYISENAAKFLILAYPFVITFGNDFVTGQAGQLSPLILAFLPLALLLPSKERVLRSELFVLTLSAAIGAILSIILIPAQGFPIRYTMPVLLMLIPLAAKSAVYIMEATTTPRILSIVATMSVYIALFSFSINVPREQYVPYKGVENLIKPSSCDDELRPGGCNIATILNEKANNGDRILIYSAAIHYWLRPGLFQCAETISWIKKIVMPEDFWEGVVQQNFRYLAVYDTGFYRENESLEPFLTSPPEWIQLITLREDDRGGLYQLDYIKPPMSPQFDCRQISDGVWKVVPLKEISN